MGEKKSLVKVQIVAHYTPVHPALDFYDGKAITSIGERMEYTYSNGDTEFKDGEIVVMSSGENFIFSRQEFSKRLLYYNKQMDLPLERWEYSNMVEFCQMVKESQLQINPMQVYTKIKEILEYFMEFDDPRLYTVVTCFIIYTYFYPMFQNAPIVQLWGEMASGKTKLCDVFNALCFNPVNSANISVASVFRLVEGRRATLILDESEDLMNSERGKEITNLLLAGYSDSGETFRQEKQPGTERFKTLSFKVFSPKIIANIAGVTLSPLKSRIIRIIMTGAADKSKANRQVNLDDRMFKDARNLLYRMVMTCHEGVISSRNTLPDTHKLSGRSLGIWQGIIAVANWLGSMIYKDVVTYARKNTRELAAEIDHENPANRLLDYLYVWAEKYGDGDYQLDNFMAAFTDDEELDKFSKPRIARMLKRMGFEPEVKRRGSKTFRFYHLESREILYKKQKHVNTESDDAEIEIKT